MTQIGCKPGHEAPLSDEQRAVLERIRKGRGEVPAPFYAMLDAPDIADAVQALGTVLRFKGQLRSDYREVAILATAGAIGCGYEWRYHAPIAADCGVPDTVIQSTLPGGTVPGGDYGLVISFCRQATLNREVEPDTLTRAIAALGRQQTTELLAIAGYYPLLAMFIKSAGADQPLPIGGE